MSRKIVSGGQTGVDRAALDAAIELGIEYGGWCPKGGWAEDHVIPPGVLVLYPKLTATPLAELGTTHRMERPGFGCHADPYSWIGSC
jgi:putative molybdenum carrier protein